MLLVWILHRPLKIWKEKLAEARFEKEHPRSPGTDGYCLTTGDPPMKEMYCNYLDNPTCECRAALRRFCTSTWRPLPWKRSWCRRTLCWRRPSRQRQFGQLGSVGSDLEDASGLAFWPEIKLWLLTRSFGTLLATLRAVSCFCLRSCFLFPLENFSAKISKTKL